MKKVEMMLVFCIATGLNAFAQQQANKGFKENEIWGSPNSIIACIASMHLSAMDGVTTFSHTNTSFADNIKSIEYTDVLLSQNKAAIDEYYTRIVPYGVSVGSFSENVCPKAFSYNSGKVILLPGIVSPYSYNTTKLETPIERARTVFSSIGKDIVFQLASRAENNFNSAYVGICITCGSKDFSEKYSIAIVSYFLII